MFERFLFSKIIHRYLPALVLLLLVSSLYLIFKVAPEEVVMGAVQKIFYFHVGAAMSSYMMVGIIFCASILYLVKSDPHWDRIAHAAAICGLFLTLSVLFSGMIWGHSSWNVWWRWEPRLVSFLVLCLILAGYVLFRISAANDHRQAKYAAVLGILAALNIPIVIFSIKLLPMTEQLHPQVTGSAGGGLQDPLFLIALIVSIFFLIFFSLLMFFVLTSHFLLFERVQRVQAILD
jgi:heme exporter protein C